MSESGVAYVDQKARVHRQVAEWVLDLRHRMDPPPYSPERATAWRAGYDDCLRDMAEKKLRQGGRL